MTLDEFKASLSGPQPGSDLPPALQALWHDGHGDWNRAHTIAQDISGKTGAWIHAYLHRKEGDLGNAAYWYRQAGRTTPDQSLPDEWSTIVQTLLAELTM